MKLETTWWNDDKVKRIDWDSRTRSNQPEVTLCIPLRNIQIIQDPNFTRIFLPRQLRLLCWGHKNWALKLSAHNLSPNTLTESSHVNKSLFLSFCFLSRVTGFTLPTIWTIKFQNSEILHQVLLTMLLLPELRFLGWLLWRLSLSLSLSRLRSWRPLGHGAGSAQSRPAAPGSHQRDCCLVLWLAEAGSRDLTIKALIGHDSS